MKRLLTLVLSIFLFTFIACTAPANAPTSADNPSIERDANEVTVYVTRTGNKYHRGSCQYLRQSKFPMPLSEAKRKYAPCSVCRPPS
jgi:hypothetical protein